MNTDTRAYWRLSEGVVVSVGQRQIRLLRLHTDDELRLPLEALAWLEHLQLGSSLEASEPRLRELAAAGFAEPGTPQLDATLKKALQALDSAYLDRDWLATPRLERAYALLVAAHARRKIFYDGFGQCPALPETALRRCLQLGDAERSGRQKVLCVGDDDLLAIGLAALGHQVSVLEIDRVTVGLLRALAREHALAVRVFEHDLRAPLPAMPLDHDVVFTDPMANEACLSLFLARALGACRPRARVFCAVFGRNKSVFDAVARRLGADCSRYLPRYNRYYSQLARLHDYESDLAELSAPEGGNLPIPVDAYYDAQGLYERETPSQPPVLLLRYEAITNPDKAVSHYGELLLEMLASRLDLDLGSRTVTHAADWTNICVHRAPRGYLSLHLHRTQQTVHVAAEPFDKALLVTLQRLLGRAFKDNGGNLQLEADRYSWDVVVK